MNLHVTADRMRGTRAGLALLLLAAGPLLSTTAFAEEPGAGTPAALPEEAPAAPTLATVTGAQVGTADDITVVRIGLAADGATPTVSPFRQTSPERLVIDVIGATLIAGAAAPAGGLVTSSEFSTFNDGNQNVRLTLVLSRTATYDIKSEGGAIVLTLTPGAVSDPLAEALGGGGASPRLSGPLAAQAGPALVSLDFQQKDRVSRVLIGAQQAEAAVSQPERNVIAVDIPGARIPDSLGRELDTRFFYSAVDSVRAAPTRAGARVTIRLREGAEYTVSRENGLTVLAIQIPADILSARETALQTASPAAPGTPKTNGSASPDESTLITASGRSVDPASVYGSGTGASAPGAFSFAKDTRDASSYKPTGRRMSIDLQEADIHTVFGFVAEFADINIIASDDVQGKVTVRLKDVPWDEALGAVLQAKGLGAQRYGNIIRVAPLETIKAEQQSALEAKQAEINLKDLSIYVAPLNYAQADDLKEQVTAMLSPRGSLQVDTRGNQMIIRDLEENIAQARALLKSLDQANRQVNIEARFVEASSSFTRSLGIQWGGEVDATARTGYPTGAYFPNGIGASGGLTTGGASQLYTPGADSLLVDLGASGSNSALSFSLGSIGGLVNIDARLSALQSEGWGKIISNPRIQTLDNEQATVQQGARIPYVSVSQGGTQVQFIQATLELSVTPHITAEGTVFLDISLTNNRPDFGQSVQGNPAIQIKEIQTRVLVADGDTAVLGGVYATTESWSQSRVPGFGSIPLIGYLFKNSNKQRSQNEMLVFITPRVVPSEVGG